jgi:hypothetical protein
MQEGRLVALEYAYRRNGCRFLCLVYEVHVVIICRRSTCLFILRASSCYSSVIKHKATLLARGPDAEIETA